MHYLLLHSGNPEQTFPSPYLALEARDALRKQERRFTELSAWHVTDSEGNRVEHCDEPGCGQPAVLSRADGEFRCEGHTTVGVAA